MGETGQRNFVRYWAWTAQETTIGIINMGVLGQVRETLGSALFQMCDKGHNICCIKRLSTLSPPTIKVLEVPPLKEYVS